MESLAQVLSQIWIPWSRRRSNFEESAVSESESKIKLEPDGNDFVLQRMTSDGAISSIKLSEGDVITLAQSAMAVQQHILSRRNPKGYDYSAVVATRVAQIALHDEALGESILLTMIAPDTSRLTFAVPPKIAEQLLQRLPVFLERLVSAKQAKQ
jgi:hypothetical protein